MLSKNLAYIGILLSAAIFLKFTMTSTYGFLIFIILFSYLIFYISEHTSTINFQFNNEIRYLNRAKSASIISIIFTVLTYSTFYNDPCYITVVVFLSCFISGILGFAWSYNYSNTKREKLCFVFFPAILLFVIIGSFINFHIIWFAILWPINCLISLINNNNTESLNFSWFEPVINHPARILFFTFFALICVGSLLLMLPISAAAGKIISPIDAVFTSVSSVCVTGLIVLDTPVDFSFFGQLVIMVLIQTGGLGIMAIATTVVYSLGKRFSIKQERILATISGDEHSQLYKSIMRVIIFTFVSELIGAVILTLLFYFNENNFTSSLWRGIFTSVSAFCNAGFSLQSNSLINYHNQPLILQTVAFLIILGGLSPGVCVLVPKFISFRKISVHAYIVLITTILLLVTGTIYIATVEWNEALNGLSFWDKINNAWFQSVTLRTAGFNSVDISSISPPTYFFMLIFMFIGGSPGGTAGGIKTTTLAMLVLCISSIIRGNSDIIIRNRKIMPKTVYKAIAVVCAGIILVFCSITALELTQFTSSKDLVFEAFSALGTVGLSMGVTNALDEIGKIIIMVTMFLGRIGPLTIFMILITPCISTKADYPEAKITIS
ncbi:MAG: TrkH family potassium uptake protein [Victivallales bacterium]|nr:TrkH family potassium uptake protein [Victivallales bacterium]